VERMVQEYIPAFGRSEWGKPQGTLVKVDRSRGLNKGCQRMDIDVHNSPNLFRRQPVGSS
jgi:hypothetical protein